MQTISQKSIKLNNIRRVFRTIFENPDSSRQELSALTGISLITIGKIIDSFTAAGIVRELKDNSSHLGRKGSLIRLLENSKAILIIDLENYDFRIGLLNLRLEPLIDFRTFSYDAEKGYMENLSEAIENFRESCLSALSEKLIGIGVSVPGPYNADTDRVINNRIPELSQISLKANLQKYFPSHLIRIDEDVKYSARYECSRDREYKKIFFTYIGEGIGGAAIYDGSIPSTAFSYGGELGQLRLGPCGRTVEEMISLKHFRELFPKYADGCADAEKLSPEAENFIAEAEEITAFALESVCWLLDPEAVIIRSPYMKLKPDFTDGVRRKFLSSMAERRSSYLPEIIASDAPLASSCKGAGMDIIKKYLSSLA